MCHSGLPIELKLQDRGQWQPIKDYYLEQLIKAGETTPCVQEKFRKFCFHSLWRRLETRLRCDSARGRLQLSASGFEGNFDMEGSLAKRADESMAAK